MPRPLLYVDVDGVLNAWAAAPHDDRGRFELVWEETLADAQGRDRTVLVRVPAGTRERVRRLERAFECVWATTWRDHAPRRIAARAGFGSGWPVLDLDDPARAQHPDIVGARLRERTDKLAPVLHHASGRPFAFVDDDVARDAHRTLRARTAAGTPSLLVQPDPAVGLTDEETDVLLEFARDPSAFVTARRVRLERDLDGHVTVTGRPDGLTVVVVGIEWRAGSALPRHVEHVHLPDGTVERHEPAHGDPCHHGALVVSVDDDGDVSVLSAPPGITVIGESDD